MGAIATLNTQQMDTLNYSKAPRSLMRMKGECSTDFHPKVKRKLKLQSFLNLYLEMDVSSQEI
jgi:hypothetical protein